MIINDCAPSPQNAPGAINTEWVSTATVFRGLSGSFSVPPALIRPSLPIFLHSLFLWPFPQIVFLQGEHKGMSFTPHHALMFRLFYSNLHLVVPLEPTPWIIFLGATLIATYLLLPLLMLRILKGEGLFKCYFVFQPLYSLYFKISCIFMGKNPQNTDKQSHINTCWHAGTYTI